MEHGYTQDPEALQDFGRYLGLETKSSSIAPRSPQPCRETTRHEPGVSAEMFRNICQELQVGEGRVVNTRAQDAPHSAQTLAEALIASTQRIRDELALMFTDLLPGVEITNELVDKLLLESRLTPEATARELYAAAQARTDEESLLLEKALEQKEAQEKAAKAEEVRQREAAEAKARREREARQQAALDRMLRAEPRIDHKNNGVVDVDEEWAGARQQTTQEWAQANPSQAAHMIGYGLMHHVHELPPWRRP
jgi:hypothetical protein